MPEPDPYKEREVAVVEQELALKREQFGREFELKQKQFEADQKKGPLANVAVLVTIIVGVSGVIFGGLNYGASLAQQGIAKEQAKKAETDKAAATDQAGLQLFIQYEDKVVPCDPALSAGQNAGVASAQIAMFSALYPDMASRFQDAASAKLTACLTSVANAAALKAKTANDSPAQVADAADKARYSTLTQSVATTVVAARPLPTVWIQYAKDTDRAPALSLQKALIAKGYAVPGIQHVLAAPDVDQVRYYHDDQQPAAKAVSAAVVAAIRVPPPALRSLATSYKNLPTGVVEFWFSR